MSLKASEISDLIRQRIQNFDAKAEARDVGTIIALTDGIVRIHGLADVQYGEMIEFPGGSMGLALNLEQDSVGAVVLGDYKHISEGDTVKTTGRILEVPVGEALLGRVVDALGKKLGRSVELELEVDPSLLGGAIIRAEDMVIDDSLKTRLARLAGSLTD